MGALAAGVSARTRMAFLMNPSMPSGAVLDRPFRRRHFRNALTRGSIMNRADFTAISASYAWPI